MLYFNDWDEGRVADELDDLAIAAFHLELSHHQLAEFLNHYFLRPSNQDEYDRIIIFRTVFTFMMGIWAVQNPYWTNLASSDHPGLSQVAMDAILHDFVLQASYQGVYRDIPGTVGD